MKNKLKWKYDKDRKMWFASYGDTQFVVEKDDGEWLLQYGGCYRTIGRFTKLSSAKEVARLLTFG